MIHKFWNVRLAPSDVDGNHQVLSEANATEEKRTLVREEEEQMEEKVYRIWSVLSAFEESSAACISDMLLHVSNGSYVEGIVTARKFIWHVDILFRATDKLDFLMVSEGVKGLSYSHIIFLGTLSLTGQGSRTDGKRSCFVRRLWLSFHFFQKLRKPVSRNWALRKSSCLWSQDLPTTSSSSFALVCKVHLSSNVNNGALRDSINFLRI